MIGFANSVKDKVQPCTSEQLNGALDSPQVAQVCQAIAEALQKHRQGEMTEEDFEATKGRLKKQLPILTPHATFKNGRRKNDEALPSGLSMYDLDHIPNPRAKWAEMEPRKEELGIVMAHITPSTEGLRLVFALPSGMDLAKAQAWMAEQLGDTQYDACVKDYARCSFLVPRAYVLYMDESGLLDSPQSTQSSTESLSSLSDVAHNENEEKLCETPCDSVVQQNIALVEQYLRIWLNSSLHDLSNEARLMREHYIMRLKELVSQNATADQELSTRIHALISAIEKQRTAICGQKRMNLRVDKWWKELLQSKEMEQLWGMWTLHNEGNSEPWGNELDSHLKALPNSLYAFIDRKKLFFSRLYYSHIPRKKYWQIVSLMLLKDRMQVEGGRESRPQVHSEMEGHRESRHPVLGSRPQEEQTLDEPFTVVIPPELETPEAKKILARLQKKGLLDKDFQPVGLSQAKRGVLAWELCDHLRIEHCWKVMEVLWKCNGETIRKARERGIDTDAVMEFNKKIKNVIY